MPRDTLPPRPYFRSSTADIAAILATSPPSDVLRAISFELGFRQTRGARLLAVEVERQLAAVAALADHMAKPMPVATVEPATHWAPDHGVIPAKPAKLPRKAAIAATVKPAYPHKWLKGGNKLQTPVGGFDWAAYDAVQAEHHALIRAKYGSLAAQEDALKRAKRANMYEGKRYNEAAAAAFRAHMEKARVEPVAPPAAPIPAKPAPAPRAASIPAKRAVAF